MPMANSRAPIGGASSWFVSNTPPDSRALATPRSSRLTRRGRTLWPPMWANVSAVPSTNSATSTMAMLTALLTIVTARTTRMAARTRLTAAMRRTRSTLSATTPACTPNSSTGRFWASAAIDTRNGSRVWLATSSGPAASAIPSPMLVMTDATSSRRNPRPSREGAIRSATTVNGDDTSPRVPAGSAPRDGPHVERHDAAGEPAPMDVDEAGLTHDLGDPLGRRVRPQAPDDIDVGGALGGDPADERHDPVEPPAHEPGEAAPRPGDLEAQDAPAGPHRASHLPEPAAIVGQVAHAEGDGGGVEACVVGRQGEGVADHVLEAGPSSVLAARDVDHAGRDVDPDDPAAGLGATLEVGRDLAGAGGDVERPHPRLEASRPDEAPAPVRLLEGGDREVHRVVHAGDPVEHRADLGGRRGVAGLGRGAGRGGVGRLGAGGRLHGRGSTAARGVEVVPSASRTASAIRAGTVIGAGWPRPSRVRRRA